MKHAFTKALIAAALTALPLTATAQETYTLRMADQFPLTHYASKLSVQPFMKELEEKSGGRLKFEHYPAEQLSKGAGMLEAVRTGVADIAMQVAGYVTDRMPLSTVVELPSVGADITQCYNAFQALADNELMEMEYKPLGVRPIQLQCTPAQYIITSKPPVASMEDIAGLKLRAGGGAVELILSGIDAIPVKMAAPDIYVGVERGTIDGAILAPSSALGYRMETLAKSTARNVSFGSNAAVILMNERKFQSLPEDLQKLISDTGREYGKKVADAYNSMTDEAFTTLAEAGVEVYDMPAEVVEGISGSLTDVEKSWEDQMNGRGLPGTDILAAAKKGAGLTN